MRSLISGVTHVPGSFREEGIVSFYFEERGKGNLCAILIQKWGPAVAFNHASLEQRLRNLKAGGWPHDLTSAALAQWPKEDSHDQWKAGNEVPPTLDP
jgi:hypothetical protein